jgi:hypothetical protein
VCHEHVSWISTDPGERKGRSQFRLDSGKIGPERVVEETLRGTPSPTLLSTGCYFYRPPSATIRIYDPFIFPHARPRWCQCPNLIKLFPGVRTLYAQLSHRGFTQNATQQGSHSPQVRSVIGYALKDEIAYVNHILRCQTVILASNDHIVVLPDKTQATLVIDVLVTLP